MVRSSPCAGTCWNQDDGQKLLHLISVKSQNFLQKRFFATVFMLKKQLQTGNSKHGNFEVYSQSAAAGWLETEFLVPVKILQNRSKESTKMKKKIFVILHLQLSFYVK